MDTKDTTEGLANFLSYARKLANITRWNVEFLYKKSIDLLLLEKLDMK